MTITNDLPVNFANLVKKLDQVGTGEAVPNVEFLQAPEVDTIGELISGATTPASQRERILGAIMGLLKESGVPRELAAVAVEELLRTDPARKTVVRNRIRGGLETLKEAAEKKRAEFNEILFRQLDDHMPKYNRPAHKVDAEGILTSSHALAQSAGVPEKEMLALVHEYVLENLGSMNPASVKWARVVAGAMWIHPPFDAAKTALTEGWKQGRNMAGIHWQFEEALEVWGEVMTPAEREEFSKRTWMWVLAVKGPASSMLNPSSEGAPRTRPADFFDPSTIDPEDIRTAFFDGATTVMKDNHQFYPYRNSWRPEVQAAITDANVDELLRDYVHMSRWMGEHFRDNVDNTVQHYPDMDFTEELTKLTIRGVDVLNAVMTAGPETIPAALRTFVRDWLESSYDGGPWLESIDRRLEKLPEKIDDIAGDPLSAISAKDVERGLRDLRVAVYEKITLRDADEKPMPWWQKKW